jgi:hypothetical protein
VDEDQIELHTEMTRYDPPPQSSFLGPPLELVYDGDALEKQGTSIESLLGQNKAVSPNKQHGTHLRKFSSL